MLLLIIMNDDISLNLVYLATFPRKGECVYGPKNLIRKIGNSSFSKSGVDSVIIPAVFFCKGGRVQASISKTCPAASYALGFILNLFFVLRVNFLYVFHVNNIVYFLTVVKKKMKIFSIVMNIVCRQVPGASNGKKWMCR